ncbi:MAG: hypothetical protein J7L53_07370 [Deltaproteobacteria bacterium]|nr:hypothetical protein [Deltaproteobacteria bacterium]
MDLQSLITKILEKQGCLVEEKNDSNIEVIFPENLQKTLSVDEIETLTFQDGNGNQQNLIYYGSDFIDSLEPLVSSKGLFAAVSLSHLKPTFKNPEKILKNHLIVQNGVFRFVDHEIKQFSYMLINFRVSAIADTKAERILPIIINEQTDTIPLGIEERLRDKLEDASDDLPDLKVPDILESLKKGKVIAGKLALVEYQDFLKSLNRRLNRDLKRLQEYYSTIAREIEKALKKKSYREEDVKRELSRLEATKIEYYKKITDARGKYTLEILIEPINALRIFMPAVVFRLNLQRRKKKMTLEIPLNPISNRLEHLVCSNCHQPILNFYLCDELHLLCPSCHPDCPVCKKK